MKFVLKSSFEIVQFTKKKKITATQRAFLPLTELLIQCSEYHQSMSAESYHVLEQESILEPGQL